MRPVAAHGQIGKGRVRVDNVNSIPEAKGGNATAYTVRRLKRDNPELAERVISGELSANAAALLAGFRRPSLQIPADDAVRAAEAIRRRLGDGYALALLAELWSTASADEQKDFSKYIEAPATLEHAREQFGK